MLETLDQLYPSVLVWWIALAAMSFIFLQFMAAPYGRHSSSNKGLSARLGWLLMETPALGVFVLFFLIGDRTSNPVALVFLLLWVSHYGHRVVLFPFRFRGSGKRMPVLVALSAFAFNWVNAWVNGRFLFTLGPEWTTAWFSDPRVPHGGLFRYISCPNYFGEILEWCGWAVATWSLAGCSFALWTLANLVPRAISHHRWYRKQFADYPRSRRALVPFVI